MTTTDDFIKKYGYNPMTHGWANAPHRTAASYRQEAAHNLYWGYPSVYKKNRSRGSNYRSKPYKYIHGTSKARQQLIAKNWKPRYQRPRVLYRNIYRRSSPWFRNYLNERTAKAIEQARVLAATQESTLSAIASAGDDSSFDIDFSQKLKRARTD